MKPSDPGTNKNGLGPASYSARFFLPLLLLICAQGVQAQPPTPRLLLTAEDFARIDRFARTATWASSVRQSIIQNAENWPSAHNQRYGLTEWQLPPEGGQWTLWYVCPKHGISLQFRGPGQNICTVDNQNYTGWPYDQVIYARRHSDSAGSARDCGLAYRFTGRKEFAAAAARVLLAYADVYSSYPIHDVNNKLNTNTGARAGAQTLDEAVWLIPLVWAYDLVSDSGALDPVQRAHIERDLLREAATVIQRYNAGKSNWQSWHNAAIGAVGFALADQTLIDKAINDPKSGFRFQMHESVFSDGVWYEGAWGYHFYALDPHTQLAEMAARAGVDLYSEISLRRMFEGPLKFALPDMTLPAFNDSGNVSLISNDRLYEIAYRRYGAPIFASVLGQRTRGREALFWGSETLPATTGPELSSAIFEESGNALLRASGSDHTVAFKFGPHGGGHGHYDKLNFITYARGGIMSVDPGTQSYAAPTHSTWDKVTVAHNTVVVDERTQDEATGRLISFASLPSISAVRASAGPANKKADLERALILTPDYAIDDFAARSLDGAPHRYDWIYHNYGKTSSPLTLKSYTDFPASNGYQHLVDSQAAITADPWAVDFDLNDVVNSNYGSTYVNNTAIQATFQITREQAASGIFSARAGYDFSAAQGYILFSTPPLAGQPAKVPTSLSMAIYGDGSGHKLALRLNDSTDERFVFSFGAVDWKGWRMITATAPESWSHYLGNNDGIFDLPAKSAAIELTSVSGKPTKGALYVDDIELLYTSSGPLKIADFERLLRSLRLRMLGSAQTAVVAGNGLGPDLLKPVPFVMARRQGLAAQFTTLLEPFGEAPGIFDFRKLEDGWYQVSAAGFSDQILYEAGGALRYFRRVAGTLRRIALAGSTRLEDNGQVLLSLEYPAPVQVDFFENRTEIFVGGPSGELKLLAPQARAIALNGLPVDFQRDGSYVVVKAGSSVPIPPSFPRP